MSWSAHFEELSIGQHFQSPGRVVGESDVLAFAALTGDRHPQHCDPEWAARSHFGEQIAHGLLIVSLAVGLAPLDPERVLALRRLSEVVFKRPVRFGETISLAGKVKGLQPVDESAGLVELGWEIRNGEQALVCRATVGLLWRRAPAP